MFEGKDEIRKSNMKRHTPLFGSQRIENYCKVYSQKGNRKKLKLKNGKKTEFLSKQNWIKLSQLPK